MNRARRGRPPRAAGSGAVGLLAGGSGLPYDRGWSPGASAGAPGRPMAPSDSRGEAPLCGRIRAAPRPAPAQAGLVMSDVGGRSGVPRWHGEVATVSDAPGGEGVMV